MYDDLQQSFITWFLDNSDNTFDIISQMHHDYGDYNENNLLIETINETLSDLYEEIIEDEKNTVISEYEYFITNVCYDGETFEEVVNEFYNDAYYQFFKIDDVLEILKEENFDSIDYNLPQ